MKPKIKSRVFFCFLPIVVILLLGPQVSFAESGHNLDISGEGSGIGERMAMLVIQLGVILCAVKMAGFACERWLRVPDVLGELGVGMIIGPFALGGWLGLFTVPADSSFPISPELYGFATVAAIILLYLAGLETDISMFVRYSVAGTLVGMGGMALTFILGMAGAVFFGFADHLAAPPALFLGVISTATSVSITVRLLSRRNKLHSPEGVTILTAAVVDDVLGIVALSVVIGVTRMMSGGEAMEWGRVALVAARALVFWVLCTGIGLMLARKIGRFLEFFGSRETMATLSLGFALLLAGASEKAGLALIIGAYVMGLSLSRVDCADELRRRLEPIYHTLVSVFFCALGMMVNVSVIRPVLVTGFLFALFVAAAKVLGCGIPSLLVGFNVRGAARIGTGMLPRGEVTLVMAGIGLSMGLISQEIFGVAVIMTLVCIILSSLLMVRIFTDIPGLRERWRTREEGVAVTPLYLRLPTQEVAEFLLGQILKMFEDEECYVHQLTTGEAIYQVRKNTIAITVKRENNQIILVCSPRDREYARLMMLEALAGLTRIFDGLRKIESPAHLRSQLGNLWAP